MADASSRPRRISPSIALLTFAAMVERRFEPELKARGLSRRKYGILGHIAATPNVSYSELARRSGITVQSAHALIQALIADGLVRLDEPVAGAAARLTVSDGGRALIDELAVVVEALDAELFSAPPLAGLDEALRRAVETSPFVR
jgi:DNA-binding MarR family transcriptional regulator